MVLRQRLWRFISNANQWSRWGSATEGGVLELGRSRFSVNWAAANAQRHFSAQSMIGDDRVAANMAKALAFVLVGAGCWAVLPSIGMSSIGHAVGLMSSKDLLFLRSGANRLRLLSMSEDFAQRIVEAGGVPKLMDLLSSQSEPDLVIIAVEALANLSTFNASRDVVRQAGLADRMEEGLEGGWINPVRCSEAIKTITWELKAR
ncbi:hypothetical protein BSKO_08389 [Bryopsis sp. KO-2023]|nr:hypothetical protein BSKO_08389 [Bryopsis sp. KO-2023]